MKKIFYAVPEHAAEFVKSANLKKEGITKLDLGGSFIGGYLPELVEALKDTGVEALNMTETGISEEESVWFVQALVRQVGIDKLSIDHSDTPAFNHTIAQLEQEKTDIVDEALRELPSEVVNIIGGYDDGIEICPDACSVHFYP